MNGAVRTVGIYLYDGVEVLDFAGPYEVFTTATRVLARREPQAPPQFRVLTVARERGAVRARAGLRVLADHGLDDHPRLNLLVVPGGAEADERGEPRLTAWLAAQHREVEILASVCTGAFLLAAAGLLDGLRVTTHAEDRAELARRHPALSVEAEPRWIDGGRIVTSAGIAAGIDMSLHLVARCCGPEVALATARQMEYPWSLGL